MLITIEQAAYFFSCSKSWIRKAIKTHHVRSCANLVNIIPHPSYSHLKAKKLYKLYKLKDLIKIFGNPADSEHIIELEPIRICANIHNNTLVDLAARTVYEIEHEDYPNAA